MHAARANPSLKDRVSLSYLVSQQETILPAVQVERAVAILDKQDVALEMDYPVAVAAQGIQCWMSFIYLVTNCTGWRTHVGIRCSMPSAILVIQLPYLN